MQNIGVNRGYLRDDAKHWLMETSFWLEELARLGSVIDMLRAGSGYGQVQLAELKASIQFKQDELYAAEDEVVSFLHWVDSTADHLRVKRRYLKLNEEVVGICSVLPDFRVRVFALVNAQLI